MPRAPPHPLTPPSSLQHIELLKRADRLLGFFAQTGRLTERHLDLLWAAAVGQPEPQTRAAFKTVADLSRRLLALAHAPDAAAGMSARAAGLVEKVWALLRSLPVPHSVLAVRLMRSFAEAHQSHRPLPRRGDACDSDASTDSRPHFDSSCAVRSGSAPAAARSPA